MADCGYEWLASGDACGACLAMEGSYPDPPGEPHDNCRCVVTPVPPPDDLPQVEYDFSDSGVTGPPGVGDQRLDISVTCRVTCPDGQTFEESFDFSETFPNADQTAVLEWAEEFLPLWVERAIGRAGEECITGVCQEWG